MRKALGSILTALLLASSLSACHNDQGGGSGAAPEEQNRQGDPNVGNKRLPESNEVQPPILPDTYIDEESREKHEAKDDRVKEDHR